MMAFKKKEKKKKIKTPVFFQFLQGAAFGGPFNTNALEEAEAEALKSGPDSLHCPNRWNGSECLVWQMQGFKWCERHRNADSQWSVLTASSSTLRTFPGLGRNVTLQIGFGRW